MTFLAQLTADLDKPSVTTDEFTRDIAVRLNKPEGFQIDVPRQYGEEVRDLLRMREGTPMAHSYTYGGCGIEGGPLVLQVYRRPRPEEMPCA